MEEDGDEEEWTEEEEWAFYVQCTLEAQGLQGGGDVGMLGEPAAGRAKKKGSRSNHVTGFSRKLTRTANHLLGFQGAPPPVLGRRSGPRRPLGKATTTNFRDFLGSGSTSSGGTIASIFAKDRYVQSKCHLVVSKGDYSAHLQDPDKRVAWEDVEEVALMEDMPVCPICLEECCVPRMTRCGHIFCWICLLRYLQQDGGTIASFNKCPVCTREMICASDLRSVRLVPLCPPLVPKGPVTFTLCRRRRGCSNVRPVTVPPQAQVEGGSFVERLLRWDDPSAQFCRITYTAGPGGIQHIVERERCALQEVARDVDEGDEETLQLLLSAHTLLDQREEQWSKRFPTPGTPLGAPSESERRPGGTEEDDEDESVVDLSVVSIEDTGDLVDPNKFFFFYQSSDGQPIFLHPLDVKILAHEFGSFHDFPPQLVDIPVIQLEDFTQTEESRARFKYLEFVPLSATFSFVEVDLSKIVSPASLQAHHKELRDRQRSRKRAIQDAKIEKRLQEEEEARRREERRLRDSDFGFLHFHPEADSEGGITPQDFVLDEVFPELLPSTSFSSNHSTTPNAISRKPNPWNSMRGGAEEEFPVLGRAASDLSSPQDSKSAASTSWGSTPNRGHNSKDRPKKGKGKSKSKGVVLLKFGL